MHNKSGVSGFTLIEMLIALVVTMIIMAAAYSLFNTQQRQTTVQINVSDAQQTLRAAMDFMSRDVRMAGYDPEGSGSFAVTSIADVNVMSAIAFSWDNPDPAGAQFRNYSLSTLDGSAVAPESRALMFNGSPLAGYIVSLGLAYAYDNNDDGELDKDGGNILWAISDGAATPKWLNLDANGDGVITADDDTDSDGAINAVATGTSVDLRTIRAVRIWMLAQSQAPDSNYTDTKTYVVGPHISTPATRDDNRFRHRLLERTILCRNMGLNL